METPIVENFRKFAKAVTPMSIRLQGFGQFPKKTIYVNVEKKDPITKHIVYGIRDRYRHLLLNPQFVGTPHITIARGMLEDQYQQAWNEWQGKEFEASFNANEMLLLKREIHENYLPLGKYKPVKSFRFEGNKSPDGQLEILF